MPAVEAPVAPPPAEAPVRTGAPTPEGDAGAAPALAAALEPQTKSNPDQAIHDLASLNLATVSRTEGAATAEKADAAQAPTIAELNKGEFADNPNFDKAIQKEIIDAQPDTRAAEAPAAPPAESGVDAAAPTIPAEPARPGEDPAPEPASGPADANSDTTPDGEASQPADAQAPGPINTETNNDTPDGQQPQTTELPAAEADTQPGNETNPDGEKNPDAAEQQRQQELKDLADKINLGAHLSRLGISEDAAKQLLEQVVDSGNPQGMIESLNGILKEIPSSQENPTAAAQAGQQQENQIAAQVAQLEQQAKDGKLDEKGKQKLGVLKRLWVALRLIVTAIAVIATGTIAAPVAMAIGGVGMKS